MRPLPYHQSLCGSELTGGSRARFLLVQGAATSIYLASSPEVEGLSSKYFADCKAQTSSQESYDTEVARRLWDVSAELTGVEAKIPQAMIA